MSELATLGGGCFWCLEATFELLRGVECVTSGYTGGHVPNPSYRAVCSGSTGHAEVVQIEFDPDQITYRDLLEVFFTVHDPTTLNRQDADVGTQYRSAIFYGDEAQRATAEAVIGDLTGEGVWADPIVTDVAPLDTFYPAEDEHRAYYRTNPNQSYCRFVIDPKVAKLRARFFDRLGKQP